MAGTEVLSTDTGAAGTVMHGVSGARTHGHVKVDNDNAGANVRTQELCGAGDRHGRRVGGTQEEGWWDMGGGLVGHGNAWRWGNPDVPSMRCTRGTLLCGCDTPGIPGVCYYCYM